MQKFYQVFQIYFLCNEEEKAQIIFLHIFHLQRTLQRYHFATSETDDKSKTNVQM